MLMFTFIFQVSILSLGNIVIETEFASYIYNLAFS